MPTYWFDGWIQYIYSELRLEVKERYRLECVGGINNTVICWKVNW